MKDVTYEIYIYFGKSDWRARNAVLGCSGFLPFASAKGLETMSNGRNCSGNEIAEKEKDV